MHDDAEDNDVDDDDYDGVFVSEKVTKSMTNILFMDQYTNLNECGILKRTK